MTSSQESSESLIVGQAPQPLFLPDNNGSSLAQRPAARIKFGQPAPLAPDDQIARLKAEVAGHVQSLEQWVQAEAVWANQRRLFKAMTETVTDLIVLLDKNGNRVWNNPSYSYAVGCHGEELAGTYVFSEVHADDRAQTVERFEQALRQLKPQQADYQMRHRDGGWLHIEAEIVPIVSPEGEVEAVVLIGRDVTEARQLKEDLALATTQLAGAGMVEKLARDFDHILTNAFGSLAIAKNLNGPHNAISVRLSELERSLQRARDMIEQMFSLSPHAEQKQQRMALEPVLREAVNAVLRGTMVRAEYSLPTSLPEMDLDLEGFTHAIRNLIGNSLQAMDKGVIRLSADFVSAEQQAQRTDVPLKRGNYVCLSIQDQGQGMSEKTLGHAFEAYFTTHAGSQGLGLTTALSAIQRMGGTILLKSKPAVGTTAQVYLPCEHDISNKLTQTGKLLPLKLDVKKRVLLMDDEQMILDIVSRMLLHLGYEVTICTDGAQAIAAFAKAKTGGQPFDVVLMDLVIPNGVGGQDAVHTIRKIDPAAKVIASSGHLEHPVMLDHRKFGFIASLEKPYKLDRLRQVIDTVVEI